MDAGKALLAVSVGSSRADSRPAGLEEVERALRDAFPDRAFCRAYTGGHIRRALAQRGGAADSPGEALARLAAEGCSSVLLQPTHLLPGGEFGRLEEAARRFAPRFSPLLMGRPLLSCEKDAAALARALAEETLPRVPPGEAAVFVGHQTGTEGRGLIERLDAALEAASPRPLFAVTLPDAEEAAARLKERGIRRAVLLPLMLAAGVHARRDLAGEGEDSFASRIRREGLEVSCILQGLGECPAVRALYVRHAGEALPLLTE